MGLTEHAIALADEHLTPYGVARRLAARPCRRGGHVTLHHPRCAVVAAAVGARVIPDYRDPGGLRIGLSPLSTSYDEVERGHRRRAGAGWSSPTAR